jgi:hypothetical protein
MRCNHEYQEALCYSPAIRFFRLVANVKGNPIERINQPMLARCRTHAEILESMVPRFCFRELTQGDYEVQQVMDS